MNNLHIDIRDERQLKALIGLSTKQFDVLKKKFCEVYEEQREETFLKAIIGGKRTKEIGSGRKGNLPTIESKLLFVLYYFKVYPTFDVLASTFKMARSRAYENLHKLIPVLQETLFRLSLLPYRNFKSVVEFKEAFLGIDEIIIDVTDISKNNKSANQYNLTEDSENDYLVFKIGQIVNYVVKEWDEIDLNKPLDYVYFKTEPMKDAKRGDLLNFNKVSHWKPQQKIKNIQIPFKKVSEAKKRFSNVFNKLKDNPKITTVLDKDYLDCMAIWDNEISDAEPKDKVIVQLQEHEN